MFLILLSIIFIPVTIRIKNISCQSQYGLCNQNISDKLSEAENLRFHSSKNIIKKIFQNESLVKDYSIQFKLPDKFDIYIIEKKPKFGLISKTDSQIALVDKDGEVLLMSDSTNLPLLTYDAESLNPGKMVDSKILFGLHLTSDIALLKTYKSAKILNNSLLIEFPDGLEVIFPLEGEKDVILGSFFLILGNLDTLISQNRIFMGQIKTIDLRFKNPVITVFKKTPI